MSNKYFADYSIDKSCYVIAEMDRAYNTTCHIIYDGFSSMQEAKEFIKLIIEEENENG